MSRRPFAHDAGTALVFRIEPSGAFAFAKGPYAETAYRF